MDYISREDALKMFEEHCYPVKHDMTSIEMGMTLYGIKQVLDECPSADVVERKKGKWLPLQGYNNNVLYCSCCNSEVMGKTHTRNFCPNCGAKMEEQ